MDRFKVVITDYLPPPAQIEVDVLGSVAQVACLQAPNTEVLRGRLSGVHGILLCHEVCLDRDLVGELDACRGIVRLGVGYDNVDLDAARAKGIPVCHVPDYGVDEVADHAMALLLACHRGVAVGERRLRGDLKPWGKDALPPVSRLQGATLGLVGCGRIGSATARRALAFGLRVRVYDPYLTPGMEKALGVERVGFEQLLRESDWISLHAPLTSETHHMFRAETFAMMKPSAILVNTARGAIVDDAALADALRERRLSGAGIDVLSNEPPRPDSPLIALWRDDTNPVNLIVTPHVGYYSEAALVELRTKAAQEMRRLLQGEPPLNPVNES